MIKEARCDIQYHTGLFLLVPTPPLLGDDLGDIRRPLVNDFLFNLRQSCVQALVEKDIQSQLILVVDLNLNRFTGRGWVIARSVILALPPLLQFEIPSTAADFDSHDVTLNGQAAQIAYVTCFCLCSHWSLAQTVNTDIAPHDFILVV